MNNTGKYSISSLWLGLFLVSLISLAIIGTYFVISVSLVESVQTFGSPFALAKQQIIGLLAGLLFFSIGLAIPNTRWQKGGVFFYILGIFLLILVFVPVIGLNLNGASRWISLGGLIFQPVELMKLAIIVYFSSWLIRHQKLIPFLTLLGVPMILVMLQPDFGSMLVLGGISLTLYFLAGASSKSLLKIILLVVPVLALLVILAPYRLARISTFFNPEQDVLGSSFHVRQITLALGRGGLTGQGLGNSLQKYSYIPEVSTDSIFAVIGEELGFIGGLSIMLLYSLLLYSGYRLITQPNLPPYQQLMGLGLLSLIGIQAIINLSAVVGLIPLTGIPLPLISYGRSSQVVLFLASGMIARIGLSRT